MNRLFERVQLGVLCVALLGVGACGGGGGGGDGGGDAGNTTACPTGDEGCTCWPNKTCNSTALSCYSMLCVAVGTSGSGGAVSSGGTAGPVTSIVPGSGGAVSLGGSIGSGGIGSGGIGGLGGAPGAGGAAPPVTGGTAGTATTVPVGSGGVPGTGGTTRGSGGTVSPGTGGAPASGGTSGGGGTISDGCNNAAASVIDNFATCDSSICNLAGRNGTWFSYSSNTNIGIQCSAAVPPISWIDRGCGYYCTNGVAGATWAGAGFDLKDPSGAYDLSGYTGVYVKIETGQSLTVAIKDLAGDMWRSAPIGGGSGAVTYTIPFSKMSPDNGTSSAPNLARIVGFRFDVEPTVLDGFGFVVHMVTLY